MFRNPTNGRAKPLIPTFNMTSSNPSNNLHQKRNFYHHSPSTEDFPAQGNSDARRASYTNLNSKDEEFSRHSDSQSQRTHSPKICFSVESILGSCDKLKGIPVRSPEKLLSRQPVSQFIDLSKTGCKEHEGRSPRNQSNFTSQNVRCNRCGIRLKRQGELETHMLEHILDIANSFVSGTSG
ncbi:unnamed protein product [Calicophoron daubneyi]|uniref:C2H2-type domain-containing protein n=1 Tax=Calicophoron daubneyi TaxID=300641 RepID=A0AAV2T9Z5_CALDB